MNNTARGSSVGIIDNEYLVWELSPNLIKELGLKEHQNVTLHFGSSSTRLWVIQQRLNKVPDGIQMRLSRAVINRLHMPENISLSIKPIDNGNFRLGPVIGILTFGNVMTRKNFSFYLNYVRWLKYGLLYVFGTRNIDTNTKTIIGYYYDKVTKTWKPGEFPYPDAVMDRCYPNPYKAHSRLEEVIGKGNIFNKKCLINKFDFFTALHENKFLSTHLPETRMLAQVSDLRYFLDKYREAFIKPLNGMKGMGILNISPEKNKLVCRLMDKNVLKTKKITHPGEIFGVLKQIGSRGRYIIQNAVPRMKYRGKPFSFRVIVYKDGSGKWKVPAIFSKAAQGDSFLTNFNSGAKFILLENLFNDIEKQLPCSKEAFINRLTNLALEAAQALDNKYGPLGKLGLDIVVDTSGKPWLIEANGNPGLIPWNVQAEFPKWRDQVFQFPLAYATYLAGFNN